jgi:CheY-like chemotaxis protein
VKEIVHKEKEAKLFIISEVCEGAACDTTIPGRGMWIQKGEHPVAKIMLIDDDAGLMDDMFVLLKDAGHTVTVSDTVDGAIEKLTADKPDLLILDVMFPDNPAAGFDLARKIRQTREISKLPIILLTGVNQHFPMDFSSGDIDSDWMPVQDFVEKPVDFKKLQKKINKLMGQSEWSGSIVIPCSRAYLPWRDYCRMLAAPAAELRDVPVIFFTTLA